MELLHPSQAHDDIMKSGQIHNPLSNSFPSDRQHHPGGCGFYSRRKTLFRKKSFGQSYLISLHETDVMIVKGNKDMYMILTTSIHECICRVCT